MKYETLKTYNFFVSKFQTGP